MYKGQSLGPILQIPGEICKFKVTDLEPGCKYNFTLYAGSSAGPSVLSDVFPLETKHASPPGECEHLKCTDNSKFNSLSIEWKEPSVVNGAAVDGYHIRVRKEADAAWSTLVKGPAQHLTD